MKRTTQPDLRGGVTTNWI